ncbi:hypothetical protein [Labilibaculum antarcticum]|uniref:Uncharacterized protein n=1 Tax=Labilibaculum antarcticum TaxID=1717717 RepID=A0A1Y1CSJ7_9BACT|nr:hypothetical protein [Labilibaculum antarcticum]BAX82211.1 hypothetical protein ALGA_3919 [Labilibaculum antarcticum]
MELETVLKLIISIAGLISVIIKLLDSLSQTNRKRKLKTDLELLEKINSGDIDSEDKEKINKRLKEILHEYLDIKETTVKWFDIFYALTLFVGFGWWTIYIYEINTEFSPWTILTGLLSFVGLSLLIDNKWRKKKEDKVILKITILDGFKYAIVMLGLASLIGFFLYAKYDGYTHWYILIGVFIPIGFKLLADGIKLK